ncbi:MAG: ATP-binding protein [Pseudomonadota bacterium]
MPSAQNDTATSQTSTLPDTNEVGSETEWSVIIDAIADPAVVLDEAGLVVHHNPPVVDLYPRVRVGTPVTMLSREPDLLSAIDNVRNTNERITVQLHDRVPVTRRMSAIITRINVEDSRPGGPAILIMLRDLTDQEQYAQMRTDFIAHASHELRTPLASLKVIVETLQGPARDDPEKRERFLSMMLVQATRMSQLIDDLLSLSRVEMRAHLPPRDSLEVGELAEAVVQSLEPLAESHQISLKLGNMECPVNVRGDREEIAQVLQNLVQNAIRYGRPDGTAEISVSRHTNPATGQEQVHIAVKDNGIGIPPEHIPRLTERFYRVSAVDSRAKGGTGLGLAIVKHIVTRHRGELEIISEVGKGSTFTVILGSL